ncbi:tetratricopeptide repeat protein, partial [Streptomyces sp. N35]|uniref:tetratricopeptide repeat protein n=1 Tax=Streptomyces sp. N35 TaxID=2795730 RepID=UPI0018F66697
RALPTTRVEVAVPSGKGRVPIPLDLYTQDEARAFLHRRLTDAGHAGLYDTETAGPLAEELGRLPLALGHAAAYLINRRCTTGTYLTRFRDTSNRLGDLLPPDADTEGYGRPVTTALLISLDAVGEVDTTQLAEPLLHLISLTDPLGHPAQLWTTSPALQYLRTCRPVRRRWLRRRTPQAVTEQEVQEALALLRTYALVGQETDEAPVRIHALTARAVRETIRAGDMPTVARAVADALLDLWPEHGHEDWALAASLRATCQSLDGHSYPALWQPEVHGCVLRVSNSLSAAGLFDQAVDYDRVTVHRSIQHHGPNHPQTFTARNSLTISYREAGRHREALDLGEQIFTDCERELDPNHPVTLKARLNLAISYSDAGRRQEALALHEQILTDHERELGPHHLDTLTTRHSLAVSYSGVGRHQEALDLGRQALTDHERELGPNHLHTLTTRHSLALSYREAGRHQEALDLLERVLTDYERELGPNHPDTLTVRLHLAVAYSDAGRHQEALDLGRQALTDHERELGPEQPRTLTALNTLAYLRSRVEATQQPSAAAPDADATSPHPPSTPETPERTPAE